MLNADRPTRCQHPGCHNLLHQRTTGRAPKWCSDRHSKQTMYARYCIDCGTQLNGSNGNGPNAATRCRPCNDKQTTQPTERWIIDSIHEWHHLFGRPPTAMEWSPAQARHKGRPDLVEQHKQTGRPWPAPSTVIKRFGSWNQALQAEPGITPVAQGQRRDPEAHRNAIRAAFDTDAIDQQVAALYQAGVTLAEIAQRINTTDPGQRLARMRREGWDLPYRKPPKNTAC